MLYLIQEFMPVKKDVQFFFEKQNVQNLTALTARGMLVLNSMLSIGKKKEK